MSHFKLYQRKQINIIIDLNTLKNTNEIDVCRFLSTSFYDQKEITVIVDRYEENQESYDNLINQFTYAKEQGFRFALHYKFLNHKDFIKVNKFTCSTATVPYYKELLKDMHKVNGRIIVEISNEIDYQTIIDAFNFFSSLDMDLKVNFTKDDLTNILNIYLIYKKIQYRKGAITNIEPIFKALKYTPESSSMFIPEIKLNALNEDINQLALKQIEHFKTSKCHSCPINDYCKSMRHKQVLQNQNEEFQCEIFKKLLINIWKDNL